MQNKEKEILDKYKKYFNINSLYSLTVHALDCSDEFNSTNFLSNIIKVYGYSFEQPYDNINNLLCLGRLNDSRYFFYQLTMGSYPYFSRDYLTVYFSNNIDTLLSHKSLKENIEGLSIINSVQKL